MTNSKTSLKAGEVTLFTEGEYSDYHPTGLFKVLKDFNVSDFMEEGKATRNRYDGSTYEYCSHDKVLAAMIRAGVIEELEYREINGMEGPIWMDGVGKKWKDYV